MFCLFICKIRNFFSLRFYSSAISAKYEQQLSFCFVTNFRISMIFGSSVFSSFAYLCVFLIVPHQMPNRLWNWYFILHVLHGSSWSLISFHFRQLPSNLLELARSRLFIRLDISLRYCGPQSTNTPHSVETHTWHNCDSFKKWNLQPKKLGRFVTREYLSSVRRSVA